MAAPASSGTRNWLEVIANHDYCRLRGCEGGTGLAKVCGAGLAEAGGVETLQFGPRPLRYCKVCRPPLTRHRKRKRLARATVPSFLHRFASFQRHWDGAIQPMYFGRNMNLALLQACKHERDAL